MASETTEGKHPLKKMAYAWGLSKRVSHCLEAMQRELEAFSCEHVDNVRASEGTVRRQREITEMTHSG